MRIFLTGHSGLLGRTLVPILRSKHEVLGVSTGDMDVCDAGSLRRKLEDFRPETVIHLAAATGVDACESARKKAMRENVQGSRTVAEEAERVGASVLALSTDYVFDGRAGRPYREEDPTGPLNVYGESKLLGEEAIREGASVWTVVRSAWFYGPGRPNFVTRIQERLERGDTVSVVHDQIGSPTYTEDLARGLEALIESRARGLFHLVNAGRASWFDLARRTAEILGADPGRITPITTEESGRPAARPPYAVLDTAKAAALGVRLRPWEEALAEYLGG